MVKALPPQVGTSDVQDVGRLVWDWRRAEAAAAAPPDPAGIRRRALARGLVGGLVAGLVFVAFSQHLAGVIATIAGLSSAAGVLSPTRAYAAIEKAIGAFAFGVGAVLTWVMLVPMYYFVFAPFGVLGRRRERARLYGGADPEVGTYWIERVVEKREREAYLRQF